MNENDLKAIEVILKAAYATRDQIVALTRALAVIDVDGAKHLGASVFAYVPDGGGYGFFEIPIAPSSEETRAIPVLALDANEKNLLRTLCETRLERLRAHFAAMKVKL